MRQALTASILALLAPSTVAPAADRRAALFEAVVRCRSIADVAERVACYDRSVEALSAAERKQEIAVVDRAQVQATRKSLFGLALPRLPIFGSAGGPELTRIEGEVAAASLSGGAWVIRLADGATWRQVDDVELGRRPRPGDKVAVNRAALGSYRMTVAGGQGFKARREP